MKVIMSKPSKKGIDTVTEVIMSYLSIGKPLAVCYPEYHNGVRFKQAMEVAESLISRKYEKDKEEGFNEAVYEDALLESTLISTEELGTLMSDWRYWAVVLMANEEISSTDLVMLKQLAKENEIDLYVYMHMYKSNTSEPVILDMNAGKLLSLEDIAKDVDGYI